MAQPIVPYQRKELYCLEAEQSLLGLLILYNDKLEEVIEILRPFYFYHQTHQKIYQTILHLADINKDFSPITLPEYMNDNDLADVGGRNYLIDLPAGVISAGGASHYAEIIADYYLRREIAHLNDSSLALVYNLDIENRGKDCLEAMERKIFELSETRSPCQNFLFTDIASQIIATAEDAIKNDKPSQGITTGFIDLDKWLGGLYPTDLVILGGRPSMGKTSLGLNIALNASKVRMENQPQGSSQGPSHQGCPVAVFSFEMSREQLLKRVCSR